MKMVKAVLHKFVTIAVVGSLALLGLVVTSSAAMADSISIPINNGGQGTTPPPKEPPKTPPPSGGGNDDVPGGGGGGGGGQTHWEYVTTVVDYRTGGGSWVKSQALARCAQTEETVGAKVNYRFKYSDDQQAIVIGSTQITGVTCLSLTTWTSTMRCYVDVRASLSMVVPRTKTILGDISSSTPWGAGDHSVSGCNASQSVYLNMNVDVDEYGRYQAPSYVRYQTITVKHWGVDPINGSQRAPEVIAISGISNTSTRNMYAQLTCAGGNVGANQGSVWTGNWTWTETDCGPENTQNNPVTYQCTAKGTPTINGQALSNANITRSGEANSISWAVPAIVGNTVGPINTEATMITRSGTPWTTSDPVKSNDVELWRTGQNRLANADGTGWMNGTLNAGWDFRAIWASDAGKPTVLTPSFRYNANWVKNIMVITGMNPFTGEASVSYRTTTVNADAICKGAPLSIMVTRTVNNS